MSSLALILNPPSLRCDRHSYAWCNQSICPIAGNHLVRASERHANRLEVQRLQRPELHEVDVGTAGHDGVDGVLRSTETKQTRSKIQQHDVPS